MAVDKAAYHFDKQYSYAIPVELAAVLQPGMRVLVPFGGGNRKRQGIVLSRGPVKSLEKLKPIISLLDSEPVLSPELLRLVTFLKETTFCAYFDAVKAILPGGIGYRMRYDYGLSPLWNGDLEPLEEDERQVVSYLGNRKGTTPEETLLGLLGLSPASPLLGRMLQKGILVREETAKRRMKDETVRMLALSLPDEGLEGICLTPKQKEVLEFLQTVETASVRETVYFTGVTEAVFRALQKKGLLYYYDAEILRQAPVSGPGRESLPQLTLEQEDAYQSLLADYEKKEASTALLYGVTGSGKTQVYLKLIAKVVEEGKQVIVLVPEISLTPQAIADFTAFFGERVAIQHSGLSLGERMDQWKKIRAGQVCIAVGTRSAIFAPFTDLGLIIVDEEQEHTYKSEASPRFHTRDVAKFRSVQNNCLLVLASATPSVESYYYAQKGAYHLVRLEKRYGGALLPNVEVVDMGQELRDGNDSQLSRQLLAEMEENLQNHEQTILLLNRRGYHTKVICTGCNTAASCPNCSIAMTYHAANGRLMCHYCGYSRPADESCPVCGGRYLRYQGIGTQKLEEELHGLFPDARILRMDADTTMTKNAHSEKFQAFAKGEYDIMVGTQMVAKGLNFPQVTLVGVLAADASLFGDDFKCQERAFSLITQVIGRSGRGQKHGRALIQTFVPDNAVIEEASCQDYDAFFKDEILGRKVMLYPPFCSICAIGFSGPMESQVIGGAKRFLKDLKQTAAREYAGLPLRVLGPTANMIVKISGKYRYKILIKCKNTADFRRMIASLLVRFGKDPQNKEISAFGDLYYDGSM
ncbi:MAG: primosomal protein N' [Oscillospiraceae bacterium]|nr:primosomal protein N' [Oscillospiraceae bacterium]